MWELPLCRAWHYYHCAALADGANTEFSDRVHKKRRDWDAKFARLTRRDKQ